MSLVTHADQQIVLIHMHLLRNAYSMFHHNYSIRLRVNPLTPTVAIVTGTAIKYKASGARPGWAVICNIWHPGTLTLSHSHMATVGVKGLINIYCVMRVFHYITLELRLTMYSLRLCTLISTGIRLIKFRKDEFTANYRHMSMITAVYASVEWIISFNAKLN